MFYAFLVYYLEIEGKRFSFIKVSLTLFGIELIARTTVTYMVKTGTWPESYLFNYNNLEDFITLLYSLFLYYKAIQIVFKSKIRDIPVMAYDDLRWLKWFFYLAGVVCFLWMLSIFFNVTELVAKPYSYYPLRLGSSLLIYWIGYQGFFRYVVLKDRISLRKEIRKNQTLEKLNSKDKEERGELAFSQVDDFIVERQKFLDPNLSLDSLADELGKSTSHLSKLMNTHAGSNFSDYINKYRIAEAKKLLADDSFDAYTIVAIGLECGFNSKSTFYTAFKKFTGQTPTAYRKMA
jgi:AraC-like DNA-binding protein